MYRRTAEELNKFIKKPYQPGFTEEILGLYSTIEHLQTQTEELVAERNKLQKNNDQLQADLNNIRNLPKYKLADAIDNYINSVTLSRDEIRNIVRNQVTQHLNIKVNTDKVHGYDSDYWYESSATVNWK